MFRKIMWLFLLIKCLEKKAKWELHNDNIYYFELTLEAAPNERWL